MADWPCAPAQSGAIPIYGQGMLVPQRTRLLDIFSAVRVCSTMNTDSKRREKVGDGEMGRWGDGEMGRWGDGEMGRWGDGEMGRWGDGEMGRWGDGEMGRWGDGEMGRWGGENAILLILTEGVADSSSVSKMCLWDVIPVLQ